MKWPPITLAQPAGEQVDHKVDDEHQEPPPDATPVEEPPQARPSDHPGLRHRPTLRQCER